jgi:hypothetical protein
MDRPEPVSLSFDKAKFDESGSPSLSCAFCKRDVFGTYYEINGQTACEQCRFKVESSRTEGRPSEGPSAHSLATPGLLRSTTPDLPGREIPGNSRR